MDLSVAPLSCDVYYLAIQLEMSERICFQVGVEFVVTAPSVVVLTTVRDDVGLGSAREVVRDPGATFAVGVAGDA